LRAGEAGTVEVIATGAMPGLLELWYGNTVTRTASGVRIEVADEKEVDEVIASIRKAKGKLVSVQPVRQSLEELFVDK
jgi:hypothetical protein